MSQNLTAWRDAAVAGGLPQPHRERWQALRAGVVNLWEFEAVEYWYANGWAQLMGRNETGKSSLMALTTLIPWLADTASDKIDTLGRSGKQFSYYVRPTGAGGDRRDASASSYHGWLWVEYGRLVDGEPRFFTTLLHASARSGNPTTKLTWCTAEGSRVREALRLTIGREVQQPKDIDVPGFEIHPRASSYKATMAMRLLGSDVAQLEGIGKILKVTRTPKLGAQLDARFVTERLRDALPELQRSEVNRLAEGWDQLDQIRDDLARIKNAAGAVARFATHAWRPWLGATLRHAADEAASRQTTLDRVTREERQARAELDSSTEDETRLEREQGEARLRHRTARGEIDVLRASTEYRGAQERLAGAERAERDAAQAVERRDRSARDEQDARRRVELAQQSADAAADQVADAEETHHRRTDDLRAQCRRAGLEVPDPLDPALVQQRSTERRQAIRQLGVLMREHSAARHRAGLLESAASERETTAEEATQAAEQAWQQAEAERDDVASRLRRWASNPPEPVSSIDGWIEAMPDSGDVAASPRLADVIRAQWHDPHRLRISDASRTAREAREEAETRVGELRQEIERLETAGVHPPPAPTLWRRRDRADVPGAPLWRLVNPVDSVPTSDLAHVEAALAAAGLLDAWVSPDGVRDALDTFVTIPEPGAGERLNQVLAASQDAGEMAPLVQGLLDGVRLCSQAEPLPSTGLAVSRDGRWCSSALAGRAAPMHEAPEWLGESAREAQRQRRMDALRREVEEWEHVAASHGAREKLLDAALARLDEAFAQAPTDEHLRALLVQAADRSERAESAQTAADRAMREAQAAGVAADQKHAAMTQYARDAGLPAAEDALDAVRDALGEADQALVRWRSAATGLAEARQRAEHATAEWTDRRSEYDHAAHRLADDEQQVAVAEAQAKALREAIDAQDSDIFERIRGLEDASRLAEEQGEALGARLMQVAAARAAAQTRLGYVEDEREAATLQRNSAHTRLRQLLDRDVATDLRLDLPEPHSSTVEHVRAQAAEIRRTVTPRSWQDDAESNAKRVSDLRLALENRAREVRSELEQGGRSLQITPDEVLDTVEVTVDSRGQQLPVARAIEDLADKVATLETHYDEEVRKTLDELLGSAFLEHMREQIGGATSLINDINRVLVEHPTGTNQTTLRIKLEAGVHKHILDALSGPTIINPEVQEQVREFLKQRVDEARRTASDEGLADWRDSLAHHLDYRTWFTVALERRFGTSNWGPLTVRSYAELSGGARAVMLMLPLVAALAALYRRMPEAPRPLWLDEAFDGLDSTNRSMVMSLLRRFDLDVLLAGPGRLVNVKAVPAAAIYQVVRAPAPHAGADLTLELWAGNTLEVIDLPLSWLDDPPPAPQNQDSLL